ncbi:Hsp33 family molecular chaperone HslO [Thiococcus pfennigii]|uniref:Hsp33 family molecular chaperone HslO n=1 Tax=Thiococcus pfennigii TaxID=1057 RepID=UPI0019041E90|nr:Hsp33 family molecular chaperone HslO [Thiococcus pfennigii]MBK1700405.1 redox-regulated molecular chaperone Hsp33 [Thiococcus pfennigii]MBK1731622.1 redox-regulated molecular chaperone Hsp33 [Thiococcus pfennigii]
MSDPDSLHRFLFEQAGVRGELAYLDASWRAVLAIHPYPLAVQDQLGQALAAVALLSATIKFEGSLILQVQGDGPLRTLVAQATDQRTVRGLARWTGEVPLGAGLTETFGAGRLVLTIERRGAEPYQGIVPLEGRDLAEAIGRYFSTSEQLPTRLWLEASPQRAAGMLLQRLPSAAGEVEDWERIGLLAGTLTRVELLGLPAEGLLHRLFHEEQVRLFESEPIAFRCGCSRQRIEDTLRALGQLEVERTAADQGGVAVTCEFCNREYRFDPVDIQQLFVAAPHHQPPAGRH